MQKYFSIQIQLILSLIAGIFCSTAITSTSEVCVTSGKTECNNVTTDLRIPKSQSELATTSAAIYLANLKGQIASYRQNLAEQPDVVASRKKLAELTYLLGLYRGDLHRQQQAIDELTACIARDGKNAELYIARARMLKSLHRFSQAQADIDKALELGIGSERVAVLQQDLDWNAGKYDAAIQSIRRLAKVDAGFHSLARVARLEFDLGNHEKSERGFEAAEDAFVGTNPFALAWLNVQRGLCHFERGQLVNAIACYEEAVRRMPDYELAREHLAEALYEDGQVERSLEIYETVLKKSANPEVIGAVASIYRELGNCHRANELKQRAKERFTQLLGEFPEAMYAHASGFFLEEGRDPQFALRLTRRNVEMRPNSDSYQALARAQLANNQLNEAEESVEAAMAMPVKSIDLLSLQNELRERKESARRQ